MMLEFLTRRSLSLILFSYAFIIVLLAEQLNALLILFGLFCALWRIAVFTGRVPILNKYIASAIAIGCSFIIIIQVYPSGIFGVLVHLVVLGFSLKFIELKSVRDVHFFCNTGFVLIAVFLVSSQSIVMSGIAATACLLLLSTLISMHGKVLTAQRQFTLLGKAALLSLPLAMVLFVVLPRLPSMWKMPLQNKATTGLTDRVTPGSIAELSQSPELAFRVSFTGELPPKHLQYWRVLTLDQFDGKTWFQSKSLKKQEAEVKVGKGKAYELINKQNSYQLILEPHYKHYLPSLDFAYAADSVILGDFSLRSIEPVYKRQSFEIEQYQRVSRLDNLPESLDKYVQLPDSSNPETKRWINKQLALGKDKYTVLEQLLDNFNQDNFRYTLQPPILGEQQIDDFLFSSQAGFCVHYASTYLFVARALNIPARMVTGYLGGEWQQSEQFLTVRQYDAHAWVEIWKGNQWQRVDPTSYVSPDRVEKGLMQSLDNQSEFLSGQYLSLHHWQQNKLLNELRTLLAKADYMWAVWVINYDNEKQFKLFHRLLKSLPWLNLSMLILLLLLCATSIVMLWVFKPWQRDKLLIEDKVFNQLYQTIGKKSLQREKSQTLGGYCEALTQYHPNATLPLTDFSRLYNQLKYQVSLSDQQRKALIKQLIITKKRIVREMK